ncbi:TonB-dependent receptor [Trichlorobacter lovleyi]|uniref:TonB-dependent receptor n=1 Tax=Trichlorobacter lovleyi TaxID=313985 RepID=UPI00223F1FE4|nr:TonB-dependent receptor [Trichlorobacter lovleyi]QOX77432.1 TonB-dependent receptor [Trichlorobacter lovleyi]
MPFFLSKKTEVLPLILTTGLLILLAGICSAEEPESTISPAPADPREVFRLAGVSSFTKGALSNIVIRGYQRENLMITFDGAPYFGATPFRIDAPPFLLQNTDISTIIVTKGPYNLAYPGAAGGSVEVVSPANPPKLSGKTSFSYGSYDVTEGRAFVSVGNERADFGAGYLGRYSGVPEAGNGVSLLRTTYPGRNNNYRSGSEEQPMYRIDSFWLKGGLNLSKDSRMELSYAFLQGTDIKVPTMNFDVSDEQVHRLNGRLTVRNISPLIREISLQGWWSRARTLLDDRLRLSSDPTNAVQSTTSLTTAYRNALLLNQRPYAMSNRFVVDTTGARLVATIAPGAGELRKGVDFYQRTWSGSYSSLLNFGTSATPDYRYNDNRNTVAIPDVTTRNIGLFGLYELPLTDTLRTVLSVRGDVSRVDAEGLVPGRIANFYQPYYPGQVIPYSRDFADWGANAQLFWKLRPDLELFLKAGRASRIPDGHELYVGQNRQGSNLLGNPFLRQTVVHQVDAGVTWVSGRHHAELTTFYSQATDFILPVSRPDPDGTNPLTPARSTTNLNATIWGVEFDGTLQLPAYCKLSGMVAYSEGRNRTSGRPLAEIPPLRGRLALQYDDRRFFAGISQTLVARQNRFDATLNETSMPGYCVTDLHLGTRYNGFTITAAVNNLFDSSYVQPLSYQRDPLTMAVRIPESGRNFALSASYRF